MKYNKFFAILTLFVVILSACAAAATPVIDEIVVGEAPSEIEIAPEPELAVAPVSVVKDAATIPAAPDDPGADNQLAYAPVGQKMVIKDAELEILVQNTDIAIAQVNQLTGDYDGYIISTQSWYVDGFKHATVRIGIPSVSFETVVNQLRDLGLKVIRETASGQDVSSEYVDLQSKLTNLETTADRIREFMDDAQTIDETLTISQKLSELEAQIEEVKGQMRYYEGRSAYSTVTVNLVPQYPTPTSTLTPTPTMTPTPTATPTPIPGWNPGETFNDASDVIVNITQNTIDILIWVVIVLLPVVIVITGVIWTIRWALKKLGFKQIPTSHKNREEE